MTSPSSQQNRTVGSILTLSILIFLSPFLILCASADSAAPYTLNPSDAKIVDSQTACDALRFSIPSKLASAKSTKYSEPLQLTNVITKLYLNGDNPSSQNLYNDIPTDAFGNSTTDTISAIVKSAGDWDRESVMADDGYGLEDSISTENGGLPSFCRFGASIVTSNTSSTWFETWLPVPSNGTDFTITSSTSFSSPFVTEMKPGAAGGTDFKRRKDTNSRNILKKRLSPPSQSSNTSSSVAPIVANGIASRANWRGRLVFVGSGGQRGSCSYPEMKQVLARYHEATASSNLGHFGTGSSSSWTIGNPEAQLDFGYRGTHVAALASRFVVREFYGVSAAVKSKKQGAKVKGSKNRDKKGGEKKKSTKGNKKKHSGGKRDQFDGLEKRDELEDESEKRDELEKRDDAPKYDSAHFGFPTYFKGCSTGGRQAIAEAQRFPYDFDGVMAGSPAIFYNELNAYQIHVNYFQSNKSSPAYISRKLYPVIHDFILSECDTLDGLKDAVIENPAQCKPQFERLLCKPDNVTTSTRTTSDPSSPTKVRVKISNKHTKTSSSGETAVMIRSIQNPQSQTVLEIAKRAKTKSKKNYKHHSSSSSSLPTGSKTRPSSSSTSSTSSSSASASPTYAPAGQCLTIDQLANLKKIYKPYTYPNGQIIHEPVLYGSETSWTVTNGVVGKPFPPAPGWFQYQVLGQSGPSDSFDYYKIVDNNFNLIRQGNRMDPGSTETSNPDLRQFFNKGGKLIHYHGLSDQLIPSGSSDRFYKEVQNIVGRDLSNSYRYLHIPGMAHCRGGDGAWNFGGASQTDLGSRPFEFNAEFDMLLALFDWVEKKHTPKKQYGAGYKVTTGSEAKDYVTSPDEMQEYSNGVKFTHRFCPFPAQVVVKNNSTETETCKRI